MYVKKQSSRWNHVEKLTVAYVLKISPLLCTPKFNIISTGKGHGLHLMAARFFDMRFETITSATPRVCIFQLFYCTRIKIQLNLQYKVQFVWGLCWTFFIIIFLPSKKPGTIAVGKKWSWHTLARKWNALWLVSNISEMSKRNKANRGPLLPNEK